MITFNNLQQQYSEISQNVEIDVIDCLRSCTYTGGYYLERFERSLCNYLEINHVIGVSSGTDAVMLACEVLNIGQGDYVLVPNNTFIGTAFGVSRSEADIIFVDCDPNTYLMDYEAAERILTSHQKRKRIKAILVSDLYGQQPNMEIFREIADAYGVCLIEDASHAVGSTFQNKHIGAYSHVTTTSFYPTRNLGSIGQGGAIVTNDSLLAKKLRVVINQGSEKKNQHVYIGGNYKLDSLMAAQLYHALQRLDVWNDKRRHTAKIYNENFTCDQRPTQQPSSRHIYHLYEFKCRNGAERDRLEKTLIFNQIGYGFHYPNLITDTPMYANLGVFETPVAYELRDALISLPMHPFISIEEAKFVVEVVQSVVG